MWLPVACYAPVIYKITFRGYLAQHPFGGHYPHQWASPLNPVPPHGLSGYPRDLGTSLSSPSPFQMLSSRFSPRSTIVCLKVPGRSVRFRPRNPILGRKSRRTTTRPHHHQQAPRFIYRPFVSLKRKFILAWKRFSAAIRPRDGRTFIPDGFTLVRVPRRFSTYWGQKG